MKLMFVMAAALTTLFIASASWAENCDPTIESAQIQGLEILLNRPHLKKSLNLTPVEARLRVNNGRSPITSSSSSETVGHTHITNVCISDAENEAYFDCIYKKVSVKKSVLAGRPNSSHTKEIKYRIGNLRESDNEKCLSDFSIVQSRERHGTEE